MSAAVTHRTTCRLCESASLELVIPMPATPIADAYVPADRVNIPQPSYPLDLYFCRACGHLQLSDVVDPELLFRDYLYVTASSLGLVEHFRRYVQEVVERIGPAAGSLTVEIGSNDGSLLRAFQARGLRVLGVDPARQIARQATEAGLPTLPAFFTRMLAAQIRQEHGPAGLIAANNVFAHADDLGGIADGVRELLASDGVFVFEVSYLLDVIEKTLFDTVYHEHLCYHAVAPLAAFFARHGLELFDAQRIATKGGSLRGFAQRAGGPRRVSSMVGELIALERSRGLDRAETFHGFSDHLQALKREVHGALRPLAEEGKTIVGYGASPSVTTLLHAFELAPFFRFIVDDNPLKQGLFSPGHHLPVVPSRALYEQSVDAVVILAWTYAQPILKRHQAFLDRGTVIVPLPRVQILGRSPVAAERAP